MGLFGRNYDRPGPGVAKDTPRKTGAARFFELLFRDFIDYVKLSLLFFLAALPTAAAFIVFLLFDALPFFSGQSDTLGVFFLILSIPLAYPVGGALTACYFNITRLMRDDPSYLWFDFKRKLKENHKQAAITGIICTVFIYLQILLWFQMYYMMIAGTYTGGFVWVILALVSFLLFFMLTPYIFMHYAYIDLKSLQILKNSVLMTFLYLPRSFMGALCGGIIWILFALFMPDSLIVFPLILLIGISLSMLLTLSWVWPKFNKYFEVEEAINKRREEKEALEVFEDKE